MLLGDSVRALILASSSCGKPHRVFLDHTRVAGSIKPQYVLLGPVSREVVSAIVAVRVQAVSAADIPAVPRPVSIDPRRAHEPAVSAPWMSSRPSRHMRVQFPHVRSVIKQA